MVLRTEDALLTNQHGACVTAAKDGGGVWDFFSFPHFNNCSTSPSKQGEGALNLKTASPLAGNRLVPGSKSKGISFLLSHMLAFKLLS